MEVGHVRVPLIYMLVQLVFKVEYLVDLMLHTINNLKPKAAQLRSSNPHLCKDLKDLALV
jgi:hypothetical protein